MTDEIFKQQYEGWIKERDMIALEIKESNDLNRLIYKNIDLIIDFCNRIPELYIKSDLENKRTMLRLLIEVHRTGFNPSKTSVRRLQSTELFWLTKVNPTFEYKFWDKKCKLADIFVTKIGHSGHVYSTIFRPHKTAKI